jgi:tetratricopeptide (TPR) repeat protein
MLEFALPMLYPGARDSIDERLDYNERMLLRALDSGRTVAFLGSGISQAFGYPGWNGLALGLLERTWQTLGSMKKAPPELKDIESYKIGAKRKNANLDSNALMFLIGACRSALKANGMERHYKAFMDEHFAAGKKTPRYNPFEALLRLPIQRFVTTNYDWEVERALVKYRYACPRKLGIERDPHRHAPLGDGSFTQLNGPERLVHFALAEIDDENEEVFHCHGRYDDLNSVVATEGDYQHLYLESHARGPLAFQELIALLLESNPLLFIGYSLGDEDLLRPLRLLGLLEPGRKASRPIFALFGKSEGAVDTFKHAAFLERFGLHVMSFPNSDPKKMTFDLYQKLQEIHDSLQSEHFKTKEKPKLRPACPPESLPEPHCEIESAQVPAKPWPELASEVHKPGVILVIGPSGSGKSHDLLELVKQGKAQGFAGSFYWNAHYANEAVTALDMALSYFDPKTRYHGTRYDRIRQCLREHRYLLVIDGCERLLRRHGTDGQGTSYSATFHRLLEVVAEPEVQSTIVIAGQLRPSDLKDSHRQPIRTLHASRIEADHLARCAPFTAFHTRERAELSALCSLLRGHAYGLRLAGEYLNLWDNPRRGLRVLVRLLTDKLRDERLHTMVPILLRGLDLGKPLDDRLPNEQGSGLTRAFLERLALFLSPVCRKTLEICCEQARETGCKDHKPFAKLFEDLHKTGLLIPIGSETYTVHVSVRAALFPGRRGGVEDSLPSFGLSGFTSGRLGVNPEPEYGCSVRALFNAILSKANAENDPRLACGLCRDAYSLMRTRMEANTAPRWCTYQEYLRYGLEVATLVKRITPGKWTYCEHPDLTRFAEEDGAPLYLSELAWLYNDIALALSACGYVTDACFFWEHTYEIGRLIEDSVKGGGYHLEVLLSLSFTALERGRLVAAAQYLDDAERFLRDWPDEEYQARVLGLRGLMAHLQGNLQKAADLYERCLGILRDGNNLRAQSIFSKHLADIMISTDQFREADMLIRNSRAQAEAGVFPELAINARISQGHLLSRQGQPIQARLEYEAVLSEARRIGFRKLEVRALTALARLALRQKDFDGSRRLAMQSLSLANELSLGLRQSHGLVVLGLATLEAGQKDLGVAYLRLARQMAMGQQYWARSQEAENKLRELGVPLEEAGDGDPNTIAANTWTGA